MKLVIGLCFTTAILLGADAPPAKKADAPAPAAAKMPPGIPAGAVETEPGVYHFTDRDGKTWIYRKSPFGFMRFADKPAASGEKDTDLKDIKATEDGDTIRFERPSPFGPFHWQKKKSELNEMEKAAWEHQQAQSAASQQTHQAQPSQPAGPQE